MRVFFKSFAVMATLTVMVFLLVIMCACLGLIKSGAHFQLESDNFQSYLNKLQRFKGSFYVSVSF